LTDNPSANADELIAREKARKKRLREFIRKRELAGEDPLGPTKSTDSHPAEARKKRRPERKRPETPYRSGDMFCAPEGPRPDRQDPLIRAIDYAQLSPPCALDIRKLVTAHDIAPPSNLTEADIHYEIARDVRAAYPPEPTSEPRHPARLDDDWRWPEIQQYAEMSAGGGSNLADRLEQAIYALDAAFHSAHSTAPCAMVSDFWKSLDVREYVKDLCDLLPELPAEKLGHIKTRVFRRLDVLTHPLSHTRCKVDNSAEQLASHSPPASSGQVSVFSTKENRESAIEIAAKDGRRKDLAKHMKVDYRDLRAWVRDRGLKFAKTRGSSKVEKIEKYLAQYAPNVGATVAARAHTPQKNS
jgi:hypothetical protein